LKLSSHDIPRISGNYIDIGKHGKIGMLFAELNSNRLKEKKQLNYLIGSQTKKNNCEGR